MNEHIINAVESEILRLSAEKSGVIVAIDGRCASGKTTIAKALGASCNCNVFHMDDFFLRSEQRTPERYAEPGGNVDRERFLQEVLLPLKAGTPFSYRPFDCQTFSLKPAVDVVPASVAIVEGAYSCHPELIGYYDLTVFLTVSRDEQMKRIIERNPLSAEAFKSKWIPLEEAYFEAFDIANACNLKYFVTSQSKCNSSKKVHLD